SAMVHSSRFPDLPPIPDQSFTQYLLDLVEKYGDRLAIDHPERGPLLKFSQLAERLFDVDRRLAVYNIGFGDVIATLAGNSLDYIILCLGALNRGITVVPINPAMKKMEIIKYLEGVHCVFSEKHNIEKVWEATAELESPIMVIEMEHFFSVDTSDVEVQEKQEKVFDVETTAFIFYSSGTTGPPKGICIPHRAMIAHCLIGHLMYSQEGERMPLPEEHSSIHGVLPLFHAGGLITLFIMLSRGMTIVLNGKFDEKRFIEILIEKKVSVVYLVPAVLPVLSLLPPEVSLPDLNLVYIGSAPLSRDEATAFADRFPDCTLAQMYGLTEAGTLIFATIEVGDPTNAGVAMPGVQFKITADDGSECPADVPGDIIVKTATMASGYLNGEKFDEWFNTGDVGSVDDQGALTIVGRTKEMIKVRGWQVNPYELESALKKGVEGVEECAIVGVEMGGATLPHAFIVGRPNVNEVIQFVKDNFVSYKHLAGVSVVDEIPKTQSGKLKRSALVQMTTADDAEVFPLPNTMDDEDNADAIVMASFHSSISNINTIDPSPEPTPESPETPDDDVTVEDDCV
ncbi:hypothetical protein PENTCL1PPCAC_30256, partial [Pristionchus entomophagus]